MAITRTAWTDDDGSGTTGTIINNAEKTTLYDQIDNEITAALATISVKVSLLKANSGTSTNSSAENVDTIAISGLTAKDTIQVSYVLESDVEATAAIVLYNSTDSVKIAELSANAALNNTYGGGRCRLMQMQSAATAWHSETSAQRGDSIVAWNATLKSTNTQAWTGSWTLALRHGGVTATGTFRWKWAVHKIAGQ